jgi:predicted small integral membrane protein
MTVILAFLGFLAILFVGWSFTAVAGLWVALNASNNSHEWSGLVTLLGFLITIFTAIYFVAEMTNGS